MSTSRIAAFFDIDGTLLPPPSLERRFLHYLILHRELLAAAWLRSSALYLARAWRDPLAAIDGNKAHYAGISAATVDSWARFPRNRMSPYPAALARLEWHYRHGHQIILVSGTLQPLAESFARRLQVPATAWATELEVRNGLWSGRVLGHAVCGREKAQVLMRLGAEFGLDLGQSFAYGDRFADRWMLAAVGNPVAVNSSLRLAWLARRHDWPILDWRPKALRRRVLTSYTAAGDPV